MTLLHEIKSKADVLGVAATGRLLRVNGPTMQAIVESPPVPVSVQDHRVVRRALRGDMGQTAGEIARAVGRGEPLVLAALAEIAAGGHARFDGTYWWWRP